MALPAHTEGCDADPATVACDYPRYELNKVVSTRFAERDDDAYKLVRNFPWSNDDQNRVAESMAEGGLSPAEAARK